MLFNLFLKLKFSSDRVRKDMTEWDESGQWPLSCYAAFVNELCIDGMKQTIFF